METIGLLDHVGLAKVGWTATWNDPEHPMYEYKAIINGVAWDDSTGLALAVHTVQFRVVSSRGESAWTPHGSPKQ